MKQCEIIAIEKPTKARVNSEVSELYKAVQKPDNFYGFSKNYVPLSDDSEMYPPESKRVTLRADETLERVCSLLTDLIDTVATKDYGNLDALADVKIGDTVLAEQVPVTHLLFLEKQFTDVRSFVDHLPVLDSAENWTGKDTDGFYVTEMIRTHRSAKVQEPIVLYQATPEHPAQTQLITKDVIVGHWETVKKSGAITRDRKRKLLQRIDTLLNSIKTARERANSVDISRVSLAENLFNYVFAGT